MTTPSSVSSTFRGHKLVALVLLSLITALTGFGQAVGTVTGTIVGRVTDATSKVAFNGVRVTVTINGVDYQATTDQQGTYTLVNLPSGDFTVTFSYIGLPAQTLPVKIAGGQVVRLDMSMGQGSTGVPNDAVKLSEFVVSGSLLGTARAFNEKRNASVLTEILASDAIGELPDKNMVEAIQRLPGIEIVKDKGEGRYVSPRGIAPAFVGMAMNGIRFSSTEKGTRESSMDVVSATLVGAVEVSKVSAPDKDGDNMGGNVNLKTRSGFDQQGRVERLFFGNLYNHQENMKGGYNLGATYGDQALDGRLGFLIDIAADYRPYTDYREVTKSWTQFKSPTDSQQHWANDQIEFDHYDVKRWRQGGSLALDYKLSDTGKVWIRGFHTSYHTGNQQWATIFPFSAGTITALTDNTMTTTLKAAGLIKSETQIRNNKRLGSVVAGYDQTSGPWTNNFSTGWTHGKYTRPTLNISFANTAATPVSYRFNGPYDPVVSQVSGPPIGSPSSYSFSTKSAYSNTTANTTERTIKDDLRRDLTLDDMPAFVKVGGIFRSKDTNLDGAKWNITKVPWALNGDSTQPEIEDRQGGYDNFRIRQEYVQRFYTDQSNYGVVFDPKTTYGAAFMGHEEISAGYAMGGITRGKLKAAAGVRVENTNYHQTGWDINATTGALKPASNSTNYTNALPSAIFTYELDPRTIVRASWSNTIGRPDYADIAPGRAVDDSKRTVTQGNVHLPALEAVNWDASIEHFYGNLGVISAAVFYKTIKNFTYQGFGGSDPATGYLLTTTLNAPSAWIQGLELSWRQQLTFLPGALRGLGFQTNAIIGNSEATYPTRPGETLKFPGFGHLVGNFALTYDYGKLGLRAAVHYHDRRFQARSAVGANVTQDILEPSYHQIDLSSSYKFRDHWRAYLNVSNVNNAPFKIYFDGTPGLTRGATLEFYSWAAEGGIGWSY